MSATVYILQFADGSYYVGSTVIDLEHRVQQHNAGSFGGYTAVRRPVKLVWSEHFEILADAAAAERQLKGWSRAKKRALIEGNWTSLRYYAKRSGARVKLSSS